MKRFGVRVRIHRIGICALAAAGVFAASLEVRAQDDSPREASRTTEKELKIVLSASMGSLTVGRGEPEKVFALEGGSGQNGAAAAVADYSIRNRVGYLDVTLGEAEDGEGSHKKSFKITHFEGGNWTLRLSEGLPISFDIELGMGKGVFNLTGLKVKDFNLSTGASDVSVAFDEPNEATIETMSIESGVSKFEGRNLCNARFRRFHFQGGVGAYTLDFGGELKSEVDVDVEVGLGVMTIYVPWETGVHLTYEKNWVSHIDCGDDLDAKGDNEYISANYYSAPGKMNIHIDSGMGEVKVRRR
jgi:hypothetical protein